MATDLQRPSLNATAASRRRASPTTTCKHPYDHAVQPCATPNARWSSRPRSRSPATKGTPIAQCRPSPEPTTARRCSRTGSQRARRNRRSLATACCSSDPAKQPNGMLWCRQPWARPRPCLAPRRATALPPAARCGRPSARRCGRKSRACPSATRRARRGRNLRRDNDIRAGAPSPPPKAARRTRCHPASWGPNHPPPRGGAAMRGCHHAQLAAQDKETRAAASAVRGPKARLPLATAGKPLRGDWHHEAPMRAVGPAWPRCRPPPAAAGHGRGVNATTAHARHARTCNSLGTITCRARPPLQRGSASRCG
mmetsp:Transcript_87325/g.245118  ORF Transcript_87325/g.245118 Transcript_87325/m.245118 type:complete len:311 (-) Transcript_87325:773-1705(-)